MEEVVGTMKTVFAALEQVRLRGRKEKVKNESGNLKKGGIYGDRRGSRSADKRG